MSEYRNQDLGDKVAGSQIEKSDANKISEMNTSTNKVSYNKEAMSNFLNNNNNDIEMDKLKALRAGLLNNEQKQAPEEIVYKIENFFIDDNPLGITLKKDLHEVITQTNDKGFEGLVQFFKYVFERRRFQLSTRLTDKMGKPYYWAIVKDGMCDIGFKIPIFSGIDRILKSRDRVAMYITMEEILQKVK